jgi:hypothetical protein
MWNFYRLENEQVSNIYAARATRDPPLPFPIDQSDLPPVEFKRLTAKERQQERRRAAMHDSERRADRLEIDRRHQGHVANLTQGCECRTNASVCRYVAPGEQLGSLLSEDVGSDDEDGEDTEAASQAVPSPSASAAAAAVATETAPVDPLKDTASERVAAEPPRTPGPAPAAVPMLRRSSQHSLTRGMSLRGAQMLPGRALAPVGTIAAVPGGAMTAEGAFQGYAKRISSDLLLV